MHASREQAQHAGSIVRVRGLTKDAVIYNHDCVGPKHKVVGTVAANGKCLLSRQPLGQSTGGLAGEWTFVDIGRLDRKRNPGASEKILTAGRRGGEDEHVDLILSEGAMLASIRSCSRKDRKRDSAGRQESSDHLAYRLPPL